MTDADAVYEVYAVRYAHNDGRRLAENFVPPLVEPVDLHESPMPMSCFVWVIRGGNRTFVVDTGFDRKEAERRGWGHTLDRPVEDGLSNPQRGRGSGHRNRDDAEGGKFFCGH